MNLPAYAMNVSSFPEMYERHLVGSLFKPWAEILLQRVSLAPGNRVLDIACGTGIVARLAKEQVGPGGRVVGLDVSAPMLALAKTIAPNVEWREGNACSLPFDNREKFDVVLCQQGLQFFPDRAAAAREMKRVLVPGGKLGVATWRALEEVPFFRDLHAVAVKHLGPIPDQRHSFGDSAALEKLLVDAGFSDVHVEILTLKMHFADTMLVRMNAMALVGMSPNGAKLSDEERTRVVDMIVNEGLQAVRPYMEAGGGLAFDLSSNLATARG